MSDDAIKRQKAEKIATQLGLKAIGKDSFIKLCEKGCDPEYLADYLPFLGKETKVEVTPKKPTRDSYIINLRPLDSFEDALEGFEKRDLEALQGQLLKIAKLVKKLNQTRLVKYTKDEDYKTDIYKIPELLLYYRRKFIPLLLKKYVAIGKKQSPQYTEYINKIIDHIEQSTGGPNYALLCDVLEEFGIEANEGALKQKRYDDSKKGVKQVRRKR